MNQIKLSEVGSSYRLSPRGWLAQMEDIENRVLSISVDHVADHPHCQCGGVLSLNGDGDWECVDCGNVVSGD